MGVESRLNYRLVRHLNQYASDVIHTINLSWAETYEKIKFPPKISDNFMIKFVEKKSGCCKPDEWIIRLVCIEIFGIYQVYSFEGFGNFQQEPFENFGVSYSFPLVIGIL